MHFFHARLFFISKNLKLHLKLTTHSFECENATFAEIHIGHNLKYVPCTTYLTKRHAFSGITAIFTTCYTPLALSLYMHAAAPLVSSRFFVLEKRASVHFLALI